MTSPRSTTVGVALALALLLGACGSDGSDGPSPTSATQAPSTSAGADPDEPDDGGAPAPIEGVEAAKLAEPTFLLVRPGDDHLWVAERAGTVRRLAVSDGGRTLTPVGDPVLDVSDDTTTDAERGLLGLAFSADGDTLFVSRTNADGNTRLEAYDTTDDGVDASSRRVLLEVDQPFPNHNGGNVVLGPDGKLWFGLGDGGAGDDPGNRAQDPDELLGKVLRIDPDGGDPEIVVSGVRNPWRFSFDTDGSLWIADVGQNAVEEVDRLPAGEIEGANLGWSGYEGSEPYLDGDGRRPDDPVMPVFEYRHEDGNCSITGGFVYHGTALAGLE
ncbi:MAG: PQQ-dependent sugar dehydrogenase, partial [Actinobacteria bacterium]|nr:PQQ-dependent sugar dehydrogenase [Actinomycetota bacterium]